LGHACPNGVMSDVHSSICAHPAGSQYNTVIDFTCQRTDRGRRWLAVGKGVNVNG
jgi:hypothetical protein